MARLLVPLSSLEVFAEAGRLQSFRQAAIALSLTTSAVSQSIRKLEDRLGCRLFERLGNRVLLSEEGGRLLREVEIGIEHMRVGLESVRPSHPAPISIISPPAILGLLTPVINELLSLEASEIRLISEEIPGSSSFRNFDVAVLYGKHAPQHADLESLGVDVYTPVSRPDVAARLTHVKDFSTIPLLVNDAAPVSWDNWLALNRIMATSTKRLHFNRTAHVVSSLLDGSGVALESLRLVSPYIERGELVICPVADGLRAISRELTFLYVTQNPLRRDQAQRVAELIRARCMTSKDGLIAAGAGTQMAS